MERILDRANGQQVKTFVANHWTFEYDLAYAGLADELIEAIVAVRYESKNREQRIKDIQKKCEEFPDNESKSAYLYSFPR